jgi:hypothetical protein
MNIMDILTANGEFYFGKILKSICKHENLKLSPTKIAKLSDELAKIISNHKLRTETRQIEEKVERDLDTIFGDESSEDEDDEEENEDDEVDENEDDLIWQWECHNTYYCMDERCAECDAWHCDCDDGCHDRSVTSCDICGSEVQH